MFRLSLFICLLWFSFTSVAYDNIDLDLASGNSLNITQFSAEGKTLLLWLPSERGFGQGYVPVALDLEALDYDVWIAHLHESYIVPTGRQSLDEMDIEDLVELIGHAQQQGFNEVYLISSSRGTQLALKSAYAWQQDKPESEFVRGIISFSPHLVKGRTEIGQAAEYVDIASYSNLPVYMLQPQRATKFAHSWEIANHLQQGGSPTYIHFLHGVQGGFHMRPNEDLTELDISTREQLPQILEQAINLLRQTRAAPQRAGYNVNHALDQEAKNEPRVKAPTLYAFKGNKNPPPLSLKDLDGKRFDLGSSEGEVVLVNFWATWCRPCVEEIPSLSRLVERMKHKPFKVVAVNIGESENDIRDFVESIPVNFDILLDRDGHAVRDWKVYAYPSNYLLDRHGKIQYAYRGALRWDAPAIIETIEKLY